MGSVQRLWEEKNISEGQSSYHIIAGFEPGSRLVTHELINFLLKTYDKKANCDDQYFLNGFEPE